MAYRQVVKTPASTLVMVLAPLLLAGCGASAAPPPAPLNFDQQTLAVGGAPASVEIADFNGDGRPDIVIASEKDGKASVFLNQGSGKFQRAAGSPFDAGANPNDIALGDLNQDRAIDLAFANHETEYLTVLLGDGRGGFAPAPQGPVHVNVKPHPHGVAIADLNADGRPDLLTDSWGVDQVEILFGNGKGEFPAPPMFVNVGKHPYQRLRAADVNADGRADILTSNLDGKDLTVLLQGAPGGFRPAPGSPFAAGDAPFGLAVGDFNGDRKADVAVVNSPGSTTDQRGRDGLTVMLGDGKGGFAKTAESPLPAGPRPNRIAVGDLNGDGLDDIAVSSPDSDTVRLYLMDRSGKAANTIVLNLAGHPKGIAIADLNADRRADLVVTNNASATATILFGK